MRKCETTIHYLSDPPGKILFSICFPLSIVSLMLILTGTINNLLFSRYVGDAAFSVPGYLNAALIIFANIIGSVWTAAWIKTAHVFAAGDKDAASAQFAQGFAALLVTAAALTVPMLLLQEPILVWLRVPGEILSQARIYYVLYILTYLPVAIACLFLTVVNGTCSSARLFWVNIVVVVLALAARVLLLPVMKMGMVGFSLATGLGSVLQTVFYVVLFRKMGYDLNLRRLLAAVRWPVVWDILRYSVLTAAHNLLLTAAGLLLTLQTNRYLDIQYISVLSVTLPLDGIISSFSSACLAFCPQNVGSGNQTRLWKFFRLVLMCSLVYGLICFGVYGLLGQWYYGRLFQDPVIVANGVVYWRWLGLSYFFMALVQPIRSFFNALGHNKLVFLSGVGEFLAIVLCAFVALPRTLELGRNLTAAAGYGMALVFLAVGFLWNRKDIMALKIP